MSNDVNPFILLARVTVKPGKREAYLAIAADVDQAVQTSEPGMLFHNFNQDPDDDHRIVWTELYRNSDDFLFHVDNPPVVEYVGLHAELSDAFSLEIYGNVSAAVLQKIAALDIPLKHFQTSSVGYVRAERFN